METKITLTKAQKRLAAIADEVSAAETALRTLISSQDMKINELIKKQQSAFVRKQNAVKERIKRTITDKKNEVTLMVNLNLEEDVANVDKMMEDSGVIESVYSVLTQQQIETYQPFNKTVITSEEQLKDAIDKLTEMSTKLPKQMTFSKVFDLFRKIQIPLVEEGETHEGKKYITYILVLCITILMMSFTSSILILIYLTIGVYSFYRTKKISNVLNLYDSIIQYCESDILKERKESVRNYVSETTDSFFNDVELEYFKIVDSKKFHKDEKEINAFKDTLKREIDNAKNNLLYLRKEMSKCQDEVSRIESELEKQAKEKLKEIEELEKFYLNYNKVCWEKKLLENIYLGRGKKDEPIMLPITKSNTLFLSNEIDDLFGLARLFILQMLMHVNPDYLVQIILDYKYMGGNLQPFISIPNRSLTILMEQDKISEKTVSIQEDIFARNSNILKSVNSIEDFNNLMATYNATGESYVFVHIFGLNSLTDIYKHFLRNGPKVGYYFNIYLTMEEFKDINSEEMLDMLSNYYLLHNVQNLGVFPEKRLKMVVASYLEKQ